MAPHGQKLGWSQHGCPSPASSWAPLGSTPELGLVGPGHCRGRGCGRGTWGLGTLPPCRPSRGASDPGGDEAGGATRQGAGGSSREDPGGLASPASHCLCWGASRCHRLPLCSRPQPSAGRRGTLAPYPSNNLSESWGGAWVNQAWGVGDWRPGWKGAGRGQGRLGTAPHRSTGSFAIDGSLLPSPQPPSVRGGVLPLQEPVKGRATLCQSQPSGSLSVVPAGFGGRGVRVEVLRLCLEPSPTQPRWAAQVSWAHAHLATLCLCPNGGQWLTPPSFSLLPPQPPASRLASTRGDLSQPVRMLQGATSVPRAG